MAELISPQPGAILCTTWVVDAERARAFDEQVVGGRSSPVEMAGYSDFNVMVAPDASGAGVCHARGINADLPPLWHMQIVVENIIAARPSACGREAAW